MDEKDGKWVIKLGNNNVMTLKKLQYNTEDAIYVYGSASRARKNTRIITHYWPIRIEIRWTGDTRITLNRLTLDSDGDIGPSYCR